jgi:hypothetical protein
MRLLPCRRLFLWYPPRTWSSEAAPQTNEMQHRYYFLAQTQLVPIFNCLAATWLKPWIFSWTITRDSV